MSSPYYRTCNTQEPTRPEANPESLSASSGNVAVSPVRGGPHALLQQALEALEYAADKVYCETNDDAIGTAITAIRAHLDNTKDVEPIAWYPVDEDGIRLGDNISFCDSVPIPTKGFSLGFAKAIPLYLHPALRSTESTTLHPGMVLVPEEPTEAILKAGASSPPGVRGTWKAMLDAAKKGE